MTHPRGRNQSRYWWLSGQLALTVSRFAIRPLAPLMLIVVLVFGLNCSEESDCPICPPPAQINPQVQYDTVSTFEVGPLCPYHTAGDRDFAGNGPEVHLKGEVYVSANSLYWFVSVDAGETGGDTRGFGTWEAICYQPPSGWRISSVDSVVVGFHSSVFEASTTYVDTDTGMDNFDCGDIQFRGYGDGTGDDVGTDCIVTNTKYWVRFREVQVELTRD